MDVLKKSFREIAQKSAVEGCPFAIGAWNTEVYWASTSWITTPTSSLDSFIQSLRASGGTVMKQAILKGMSRFPDATDAYVMCDGDISPFRVDINGGTWKPFRQQYPRVTFHFIALGKASNVEQLQQMADI